MFSDELINDFTQKIFLELMSVANFKLGQWYTQDRYDYKINGTWHGPVEKIVSKKADIGVGVFWISDSLMEIVDFTSSIVERDIYIDLKKPVVSPIQWLAYFKVSFPKRKLTHVQKNHVYYT